MGIGFPELVVIFLVALILFGPQKLPEIGRAIGKGINEFRKIAEGKVDIDENKSPVPELDGHSPELDGHSPELDRHSPEHEREGEVPSDNTK